jgi:hypothetical protein
MKKVIKFVVIPVLVLGVLAAAAMHIAARLVVSRIEDLLGDQGRAAHIDVGWSQIVLQDVEIGAPANWPTRQTLRAARATLEPDWRALLSDRISIRRVVISDYYLSVLRTENGRLRLLPTLRDRAGADPQGGPNEKDADKEAAPKRKRETDVGMLVLENGRVDFFDSAIGRTPYRVPFEKVHAEIGPFHAPANDDHTQIKVRAEIVGKQRRGAVTVDGWVALASRDADIRNTVSGADVSLLAPYLQKNAPAILSAGQLDLDMKTRVQSQQLAAQGKITLRDLDFSNSGSLRSLPRKAVMAALEDRNGRVTFEFTLQGSLKDPKFSLTDDLSTRVVGGFAKAIGVSVEGVAEGVGSAVKGLGGALGDVLGK